MGETGTPQRVRGRPRSR